MSGERNAPADTSMMRIVHQALRRDLERTVVALRNTPPPADRQRSAIAQHLAWMMTFLHNHHESEDLGLYPVIRVRRPDVAALLDDMNADHRAVAEAIEDVAARAGEYGDEDDQRESLCVAVERLQELLLPHLRREEDELMPVVSAAITNAEWHDVEKQYNLQPKSFSELGHEGHWLIDGASPQDREIVLGLVPALPRFALLHLFARGYRRQKAACWAPPKAKRRVQSTGHYEVVVDAPLDAVWEVVRDVTRVGEWSHECVTATWLGDATSAVPGARFRGRNRQRIFRWGRVCEIIRAQPHEVVWRTVPTTLFPDSTEWSLRLSEAVDGTRIEQTFRVVRGAKVLEVLYGTILPAHRDRSDALTADLRRIGDVAAASRRSPDARSASPEPEGDARSVSGARAG